MCKLRETMRRRREEFKSVGQSYDKTDDIEKKLIDYFRRRGFD